MNQIAHFFRRHDWPWMIVLLLFIAAVYTPTLHYEMLNWDDDEYITRNPWLLNLSWSNAVGVFVHPYFANYHPLTMLSYMVDFSLWGYNPAGYRAVNILLHGATVALLFGLLRSFGASRITAFLLALFLRYTRCGWSRWCGSASARMCSAGCSMWAPCGVGTGARWRRMRAGVGC